MSIRTDSLHDYIGMRIDTGKRKKKELFSKETSSGSTCVLSQSNYKILNAYCSFTDREKYLIKIRLI